ncbi:MAG: hypothetical protein DMG06_29655 [Acidobacteria bacterium]|nr:MAG: hypothetical protein DMG06_29655 [Acidobacteriota bacterium]
MNLFRLDNKVAIIPGAAGAIGSATAKLLFEQGAQLLLADVSFEKVSDLAHSLDSKVLALKADFSLVSDCQAAVETATKHFGRLDILINNVGVCPRIPFSGFH